MDATTRVWRAYFASDDDLRMAVAQLRFEGVEQKLLTAIILTGEAGKGDLAGTIVCKLTMDELAECCDRTARTLRRRRAVERLSPLVERITRDGTTDDLVFYPDRMERPARPVESDDASAREIDSHQRAERRKRRKKRPASNQPQLVPVRREKAGIVASVLATISSLVGQSRDEGHGAFWPEPSSPALPQPAMSGLSVRTDSPDIPRPSGRTFPTTTSTPTSLPPPNKNQNTSTPDVDADVNFQMRWGGAIRAEMLDRPIDIATELFRRVVAEGFAAPTDEDLRRFVALVIYVREARGIRNRIALLTKIIDGRSEDKFGRTDWRQFPNDDQLTRAKQLLAVLDWGSVADRSKQAYLARMQADADKASERRRQLAGMKRFAAVTTTADHETLNGVQDETPSGSSMG